MFNVRIRQVSRSVEVEIGSTILQAALTAGIEYPHGCQAGNCGGCKSRIHSGEVELSPYSPFALSDEEYAQGLILACRAVPWSDCEVSWCELDDIASHPVRKLDCSVDSIDRLTPDTVSVHLKIESGGLFEFSSGQFVYIEFEGLPRREYSIASSDGDMLEFYIRRIDGGIVSTFVWDYLKQGEKARIEGPYGNTYYRPSHEGPILAIAGGSGLSAIQPIVLDAVQSGARFPVWLYHGVRDQCDLFRIELFQQLEQQAERFSYVAVLSQPSCQTQHRTGMLADVLREDLTEHQNFKAYLAGPPPMVETCSEVLRNMGVGSLDIHADPFLNQADHAAQS